MKKIIILLLATTFYFGCKKEESTQPSTSKGKVSISLAVEGKILVSESSLKADVTAFKVVIYATSGTVVKTYDKLSDMPAKVELDEGKYYVVAHSAPQTKSDFETPYYYGQSSVFSITKASETNITVACLIDNVKIVVAYADNIKQSFTAWQTVVFTKTDSLVFNQDETRAGFVNPGALSVKSRLSYKNADGSLLTKEYTREVPITTNGKQYMILVTASLSNGSAGLTISVSDSMPSETIIVGDTSKVVNNGGTPGGSTSSGGLLITEILPDPAAVGDDLGEWIELYNTSNNPISLNGKMLKQGTLTIKFTTDVNVESKKSFLLGKNGDVSTNGGIAIDYVYSGFGLPNTGIRTIQLIDNDGTTILTEMTYSSTSSGKSWALCGDKYNVTDTKLEASWSKSTKTFGNGDYGTPGAINDACN